MIKTKIIFDLGNVLFYRRKKLFNSDLQIVKHLLGEKWNKSIKKLLIEFSKQYPKMYNFQLTDHSFVNLESENKFYLHFFNSFLKKAIISKEKVRKISKKIIRIRKLQKCYHLYSDVLPTLKKIKALGLEMGGPVPIKIDSDSMV